MRSPAVSVLIPVHNGAPYLLEALDSVWSQGFTDLELVVVDDGSNDDTASILDAMEDPRLRRVCLEQQIGLPGALNAGLEKCRSPLVARLDADDRCLTDRIQRQVDAMERRPNLTALGTSAILIDKAGRSIGRRDALTGSAALLRQLRWHNVLMHPSVMFRRDLVTALGGYSPLATRFEDYELWLRLAALGDLDNLREPLIAYRVHPGQVSAAKITDLTSFNPVANARKALATSRGESLLLAAARQRVWAAYQHRPTRTSRKRRPH